MSVSPQLRDDHAVPETSCINHSLLTRCSSQNFCNRPRAHFCITYHLHTSSSPISSSISHRALLTYIAYITLTLRPHTSQSSAKMKTYSLLKALSLQLSLCTFASAFALPASPPLGLDVRDSGIDVVLPAGWAYLGCFTDQTDPQRTLSTQTGLYGLDVTIEVCIDTCIGLGFGYAGLESGFQCFCGDVTASPGTVVDAGCDIPCAGNDAELCGGALRLSVFVNQAVNPPVVSTTTSATSATTTTTSSSTTTTIETTSSTETTSSSSSSSSSSSTSISVSPTTTTATATVTVAARAAPKKHRH